MQIRSLTYKWIGPYKVIVAVGSHTYRLDVPQGTRWRNVVYTTLLKPFRRRDKPQDMDGDQGDVFKVESIVDSRKNRGVVKYRVRWVGYTEVEDTWETWDELANCSDKLQEY